MPLSKEEIYERSRARAKATESQKRLTASHRERVRTKGYQQRTATSPSVVASKLRIDRQAADQEFRRSQNEANRAARVDAENRRIARQDQLARQRRYSSAIDSALPNSSGSGSFSSTSTGQAVSRGSQSVSGGIFRVILVIVGLAILYLIVSNGGQGGTTLTNGLSSVLSWFTSPSNMFASTGASNNGPGPIIANPVTPPGQLVQSTNFGQTPALNTSESQNAGIPGILSTGNQPAQILPGLTSFMDWAGIGNINQSIFSVTNTAPGTIITDTTTGIQFGGDYQDFGGKPTFALNGTIFVPSSQGLLAANIPSIQNRTFGLSKEGQSTFQASGTLLNMVKTALAVPANANLHTNAQ